MSYLMYSELFGLQVLKELPKFILSGTFIKNPNAMAWGKHTNNKDDCIAIWAKDLPKQAHLEALLMGVQL